MPRHFATTARWLFLLCLTGTSFALAAHGLTGQALIWPVALLVLLKGGIVIDHFMGLRSVGGLWRAAVLGWLLLLVGLLAYSFTLNYPATAG